jgi:hypothetical protein
MRGGNGLRESCGEIQRSKVGRPTILPPPILPNSAGVVVSEWAALSLSPFPGTPHPRTWFHGVPSLAKKRAPDLAWFESHTPVAQPPRYARNTLR